jgi:probable nitrogen fixation protein
MAESTVETVAPATRGFLNELIKQWRAQDLHGSWDAKSDQDLLEPYIMTREKRLLIPIMSDPDSETLWRMELFTTQSV